MTGKHSIGGVNGIGIRAGLGVLFLREDNRGDEFGFPPSAVSEGPIFSKPIIPEAIVDCLRWESGGR